MCKKCLKKHNINNNKNHEMVKLKDLKVGFCNKHNKTLSYYCNNCFSELCEKCQTLHKNHNIIEIDKFKHEGMINIDEFEYFLWRAERIKKDKYYIINEVKIISEKNYDNNKDSLNLLNKILCDILKVFYNDLKIEENLIFFAKILFASIKKLNNYNDFRVNQYKEILEIINNLFSKEELENFKTFINKKKYIYNSFVNKLSNNEQNIIKNYITNIFNPSDDIDFNKTQKFIENSINYSNSLKKYVIIEKIKNPNNYIDIKDTFNNTNNIEKNLNSKEVLSLLAKYIEKNGTEVYISTSKDTQFKNIEIASFVSLFCLGNMKKYEILFDLDEEQHQNLINDPKEKENFIKSWNFLISKILGIDNNNLILINNNINSMSLYGSIINETIENNKKMKSLEGNYLIKKIEEKPIIEAIQISSEIFDKRGDKIWKKSVNKKRGGLEYIHPTKDWIGIGLKVKDKYDKQNNDWLKKNGSNREYAVAYLGPNNFLINKNSIIKEIIKEEQYEDNNSVFSFLQTLFNDNSNNSSERKSPNNITGICLFQKPELAENYAGIVNTFGYRIKIMLMCRVNPKKIKKTEKYPDYWILNPTPDEVRPYRILFKKMPSSLTDKIKISMTPIDYIISAIKSKNFSFYELAKEKKYIDILQLNKQNLNNDHFTIRFYSSNYYYYLNNFLRNKEQNGKEFTEKQIKSWICCLQLALSRNKNVKENTVVYRGISNFKFSKNIKIGDVFYFREFISTSLKENVARDFLRNKGTLLIITIKNNGINGFPNYCYNIKDISLFPKEDEILISSHCCFEVNDMKKNKKGIDEVYLTCKGIKYN